MNQIKRNDLQIAEILHEASLSLMQSIDVDSMLDILLDSLYKLVPYDNACVMLLDDSETNLVMDASRGFEHWKASPQVKGFSLSVKDTPTLAKVLSSKKYLLIPNTDKFLGWRKIPHTQVALSWLGVPLISNEKVIGLYSMDRVQPEFFTGEHARLAEMLAAHGAAAIERTHLLRDLQTKNQEYRELLTALDNAQKTESEQRVLAEALSGIAAQLNSNLDFNDVLENILEYVEKVVPSDAASILLIDGKLAQISHARGHDTSIIGKKLLVNDLVNFQQVMQTGQPFLINDTRKFSSWAPFSETEWIRSNLITAIRGDKGVIGFISLDSKIAKAFSQKHIESLAFFADQAGTAIRNARIYTSLEQSHKIAETLRSAYFTLTQSLDLNIIGDKLLATLKLLVPYNSATIFLMQDNRKLTALAVHGYEAWIDAEEALAVKFTLSPDTTMEKIVSARKYSYIPDVTRDQDWVKVDSAKHILSWLGIPMIISGKVVGVCSLDSIQINAFTPAHIQLAEALTTQAAFAIENARLFSEVKILLQESQRRANELDILRKTMTDITAELELSSLLQVIIERAMELLGADGGELGLYDEKNEKIALVISHNLDRDYVGTALGLGEGAMGHVAQTGEPLYIDDYQTWDGRSPRYEYAHMHALLAAPLKVGDRLMGVIDIVSVDPKREYSATDMHILDLFAQQAAIAINNANLFAEIENQKILAEQANNAKSAFLASVSHELRTPLTSILGFTKIIDKRLNKSIFPHIQTQDAKTLRTVNQIIENIKIINAEGERLTTLIDNVLDLAKIEAGKVEWKDRFVSVSNLIDQALAATEALFVQKNISLQKDVPGNLPQILVDPDRIVQVLINLLSNAVKFTEEGFVECRVRHEEEQIVISVIDTGVGIAETDQEKVFEQFKQVGDILTEKPQGTGLGLSISKEIVEHYGGHIWVKSQLGKGCTFSYTLPLKK